MDRLESLGNQLSQITMYDIKSMYNQAKNVVLNVSELEAKVREATNDDPWGASSTLMQDIATRTFNYPDFNEIMPSIYSRFMEKEARQWRQIYKALQLLEYLIKNGSERVVDDARAHVGTIKMLRSFHYIDDKGKDEGINIRNRAKEIIELLSDVEKIRSERRKAKANKSKYQGIGNDGLSFSSGDTRYGGFGSESLAYGGSGGGGGGSGYDSSNYGGGSSYNGGGGGGGSSSYRGSSGGGSSSFRDDNRRGGFEEYDAGDDDDRRTPSKSVGASAARGGGSTTHAKRSIPAASKPAAPAPPPPAPAPIVDLLGGLDDDVPTALPPSVGPVNTTQNKTLPLVGTSSALDDDDFADFQSATPAPAPAKPNLMDMLKSSSTPLTPSGGFGGAAPIGGGFGAFGGVAPAAGFGGAPAVGAPINPGIGLGHRTTPSFSNVPMGTPYQQQQPSGSLFGGAPLQPTQTFGGIRPTQAVATPTATTQSKPAAPGGGFDDLWNMSLGVNKSTSANTAASGAGKSIKDIAQEKAQAGLWGGAGQPAKPLGGAGGSGFGSFGGNTTSSSSSGGADDLLL